MARRAAYYSVFYSTQAGRQVLADLRRMAGDGCWGKARKVGLSADEFLVLSSLLGKIKANAEADDEMAIIVAESQVARSRIGSPADGGPQTGTKQDDGSSLEI